VEKTSSETRKRGAIKELVIKRRRKSWKSALYKKGKKEG